jgi:hypothetical protein
LICIDFYLLDGQAIGPRPPGTANVLTQWQHNVRARTLARKPGPMAIPAFAAATRGLPGALAVAAGAVLAGGLCARLTAR